MQVNNRVLRLYPPIRNKSELQSMFSELNKKYAGKISPHNHWTRHFLLGAGRSCIFQADSGSYRAQEIPCNGRFEFVKSDQLSVQKRIWLQTKTVFLRHNLACNILLLILSQNTSMHLWVVLTNVREYKHRSGYTNIPDITARITHWLYLSTQPRGVRD